VTDAGAVVQGETGSGDTTRSGSIKDLATLEAVEEFASIVSSIGSSFISSLRPTITIDQGALLKVYVNRDIIFPDIISSGIRRIN